MGRVITSKEINLSQLDKELGSQGLSADLNDPANKIIQTADLSTVTQEELESAVNSHIAQPVPQPTIEEKLASVGLSLDELRAALGGN
jgi:hypothetical protein